MTATDSVTLEYKDQHTVHTNLIEFKSTSKTILSLLNFGASSE